MKSFGDTKMHGATIKKKLKRNPREEERKIVDRLIANIWQEL
jgi:hypothetical protein